MDYDKFQVGDKVWSEAYGFLEIGEMDDEGFLYIDGPLYQWINDNGTVIGFGNRPRTFFHAISDTDEGMREAIARGEGLKRPVPRGRWEIQPGDRVMVHFNGKHISCLAEASGENDYPISVKGYNYTKSGQYTLGNTYPRVMRLYDGEEPFEDDCENMRWMMDEAIKADWTNKIKGKV